MKWIALHRYCDDQAFPVFPPSSSALATLLNRKSNSGMDYAVNLLENYMYHHPVRLTAYFFVIVFIIQLKKCKTSGKHDNDYDNEPQ